MRVSQGGETSASLTQAQQQQQQQQLKAVMMMMRPQRWHQQSHAARWWSRVVSSITVTVTSVPATIRSQQTSWTFSPESVFHCVRACLVCSQYLCIAAGAYQRRHIEPAFRGGFHRGSGGRTEVPHGSSGKARKLKQSCKCEHKVISLEIR